LGIREAEAAAMNNKGNDADSEKEEKSREWREMDCGRAGILRDRVRD
jgi:hypothetical protein